MAEKKNQPAAGAPVVVARNRKALHDYEVLERLEAGIALRGMPGVCPRPVCMQT